jgi:hypothetical protein
MIGIGYCTNCGSDEVGSSPASAAGEFEFYCLDCHAVSRVSGFELRAYMGPREGDVTRMSRPGATPSIRARASVDPLEEFSVDHGLGVGGAGLAALEHALVTATREEDLQQVLQAHPSLLVHHLRGGHGRYVLPKVRLGSEHVTDFIIGDRASYGYEWVLVELESPFAKMFKQDGDPSAALNHALQQVGSWRTWLARNLDYAMRGRQESGLGLADIEGEAQGLIIMDRRSSLRPETHATRRRLQRYHNIQIRTYDWLVEVNRRQVDLMAMFGDRLKDEEAADDWARRS